MDGTKKTIINILLGGLGGALLVGLLTNFVYYQPQLENMSKELESQKIYSELLVLRDVSHRAEEEIEIEKAEGASDARLEELQASYDRAMEHAENARKHWVTNSFADAWDEIEKSRAEFGKILRFFAP